MSRTQDPDPNPPDNVDSLLSQLDALGDGETVPPAGAEEVPVFPDDDAGKKAAHAFERQRQLLRTARDTIRALKQKPTEDAPPHAPAAPVGGSDPTSRAQMLLLQLQNEAMQNTGITDVQHPMVQLEMQRLYVEKVQQFRAQGEAANKAPQVLDSTLAGYAEAEDLTFDDADKAQIVQRAKRLPVEAQANPETIRVLIQQYVGENLRKFSQRESAGAGKGRSSEPDPSNPEASRTAASGARAGRTGVRPGGSPGRSTEPVKPPTPEEIKSMRAIGLDPTDLKDVTTFRVAQSRKGQYTGG